MAKVRRRSTCGLQCRHCCLIFLPALMAHLSLSSIKKMFLKCVYTQKPTKRRWLQSQVWGQISNSMPIPSKFLAPSPIYASLTSYKSHFTWKWGLHPRAKSFSCYTVVSPTHWVLALIVCNFFKRSESIVRVIKTPLPNRTSQSLFLWSKSCLDLVWF